MVMEHCGLQYDSALARALGATPPVISKIRRRHLPIGPALPVRILEVTDTGTSDLQKRLALRHSRTSI